MRRRRGQRLRERRYKEFEVIEMRSTVGDIEEVGE
jgi:hypothetical protein